MYPMEPIRIENNQKYARFKLPEIFNENANKI